VETKAPILLKEKRGGIDGKQVAKVGHGERTAKRKLAALIKQGMNKEAGKDRLTMIQVMLICLDRDTRRSKVSFNMFSNCPVVAFVSFVCV